MECQIGGSSCKYCHRSHGGSLKLPGGSVFCTYTWPGHRSHFEPRDEKYNFLGLLLNVAYFPFEKRSRKVVLDVPVLKMAVVPRPKAGTDNAAPRGLEAATATTAAELGAAATNAAP